MMAQSQSHRERRQATCSCANIAYDLSFVSFNMHGFNQGSHTVRDLALSKQPEVFLLQEHWLTPANLDKLHELLPQYLCFFSSAMRSSVESGLLYGRPFGGVAMLINRKLEKCTKILCSADRYIVVSIGDSLIINVYLPCVGTADRMDIIESVVCDLNDWIQRYNDRTVIIGGDFNTDLDKSNPASDLLNKFIIDYKFERCDTLQTNGQKRFTFFNDVQGAQSQIDFFLCNDKNAVSYYDTLDDGCILSDHVPITVECAITASICSCTPESVDMPSHSQATVSQLRWDHANISLYRDLTGLYLQPILQHLTKLESCGGCSLANLEQIYKDIVRTLKLASDETIPSCKKDFFKFWWDHDLDELKSRSVTSCNIWRAAGRPRSGPIFNNYRRDKASYRHSIRNKRISETEVYTNALHEALMKKQGTVFWKCWRSKFNKGVQIINSVNGVSDKSAIAQHFVSHFSKSCSSNDALAADRLYVKYTDMRANYTGAHLDNSRKFDAELVENVILRMNRGKAADLDGITVEHLCYSSGMLPYVLSKFFNLCMSVGYVPLSFGMSYTVPILKDKNTVHCKSISVDDFRGISISPTISKVFEHCILDRYCEFFVTSDNQFGFKKRSSCAHAIFSLRSVVDYYVKCGSTINMCALDLTKAFDKMNHHGLFIKLMEKRIPVMLLRVIEHWFSIGNTCVKWGTYFSHSFKLLCGVRQGGVLSPYLFAVYIDSVYQKAAATRAGCYFKGICFSILMYADDIILLAPSVSALQHLLDVCESELQYLDMSINVNKSVCTRVGSRHAQPCRNLFTLDAREIVWCESIRYLGVYFVSSKSLKCSLSNSKRSFYRSFNAIFGKVGRLAAEPVTVELLKSKCLPSLYYGLEACPLSSADFKSLEYVVVGAFMKIFNTRSKEVATSCMEMFNFPLPSVCISNRKSNFLRKLSISDNIICRLCAEYQA